MNKSEIVIVTILILSFVCGFPAVMAILRSSQYHDGELTMRLYFQCMATLVAIVVSIVSVIGFFIWWTSK